MRIRTATLILTVALGLLTAPLGAEAQRPPARIGVLAGYSSHLGHFYFPEAVMFESELRELGYVKGRNVDFVVQTALGRDEQGVRELAAELVSLKVDIIVAVGSGPARAAKAATTTIPIVMVGPEDPVGLQIVPSLARPGGNITGVASVVPGEFFAKQLQLLRETVPQASRVAVLLNPANPSHSLAVRRELGEAAKKLEVTLHFLEAGSFGELTVAFEAAARGRAEALLVLDDPVFFAGRDQIAFGAGKMRLPSMFGAARYVDAGGLMSYGADVFALYQRAARYVDRILNGTKPGDLPVERPTRFELVINVKTAKALGLTVPSSVLIRADKVIE